MTDRQLPTALAEIRDDFLAVTPSERLQLLLEFSRDLPVLPERYAEHPDLLERVVECQSPVYIFTEVDAQRRVHLHATAPEQAPTTRGFASVLAHGLDGLTVEETLDVPDDYPLDLGLTDAVSPLRMRGMVAMLARVKRRLRAEPVA